MSPRGSLSDEELDRVIEALSDPERYREAEARVARAAPGLQRVLGDVLYSGGFFGEAHESQVRKVAGLADESERLTAVRTLLTEETRLGMLIGVAVGWELHRELHSERP